MGISAFVVVIVVAFVDTAAFVRSGVVGQEPVVRIAATECGVSVVEAVAVVGVGALGL